MTAKLWRVLPPPGLSRTGFAVGADVEGAKKYAGRYGPGWSVDEDTPPAGPFEVAWEIVDGSPRRVLDWDFALCGECGGVYHVTGLGGPRQRLHTHGRGRRCPGSGRPVRDVGPRPTRTIVQVLATAVLARRGFALTSEQVRELDRLAGLSEIALRLDDEQESYARRLSGGSDASEDVP